MLLLVGCLAAQERLATAGRVLDAARQPLAGATVTFVGSEPPIGDRFANADRVVVTTDDKGRFRTELLCGSDYSCWAAGPAGADGSRTVSEVKNGVRAGTGFELRALHVRSTSRLLVSGLGPWQHLGPLRFEVAVAVAHVHREPLVFVDGWADLPTLPIGTAWLMFVVDREGHLLHGQRMEPQPGDVRLGVPPLRDIPVRVVDPQGAPIAGAQVHSWTAIGTRRVSRTQLIDPCRLAEWRYVGTTGPDGTALVRVPCREDPFTADDPDGPLLLASQPDCAAAVSGWNHGIVVDGHMVEKLEQPMVPFTLHAARSWRGRILDDSGKPLPAVAVQLAASLPIRTHGGGTARPATFHPRSAADGWFVFDALPYGLEATTLLVHTPPSAVGTPNRDAPPRTEARRVPPLVHAPALLTPRRDRPFELDLRTLPMLTVEVRDTTGGPARNADVIMLSLPPEHWQPDDATHMFQLDALGSARTRVQPGRWCVFVTDRVGFAHTTLEVSRSADLAMDLQALAVLHGQVRLPADRDKSAISISVHSSSHLTKTADEAILALRAIAPKVNSWLAANTRAAADGTFALRFVDLPGSTFEGWVEGDGRIVRLKLQPSTEPIEFDLRTK